MSVSGIRSEWLCLLYDFLNMFFYPPIILSNIIIIITFFRRWTVCPCESYAACSAAPLAPAALQPNWLSSLLSPPMLFSPTQTQVLELELLLDLAPGLLCLLLEPQDCVPGLARAVGVTEEVELVLVEEEGEEELGEVVVAVAAAVAGVVAVVVRAGGSFTSQSEQNSSIHRESWMWRMFSWPDPAEGTGWDACTSAVLLMPGELHATSWTPEWAWLHSKIKILNVFVLLVLSNDAAHLSYVRTTYKYIFLRHTNMYICS